MIKVYRFIALVSFSLLLCQGPLHAETPIEYDFCEVIEYIQSNYVQVVSDRDVLEKLQSSLDALSDENELLGFIKLKSTDCHDQYTQVANILNKQGLSQRLFFDLLMIDFTSRFDHYSKYFIAPAENKATRALQNLVLGEIENEVGILKPSLFNDGVAQKMIDQMKTWEENQSVKGVILDLRNNRGGLLSEALAFVDALIDEDVLLQHIHRKEIFSVLDFRKKEIHLPLVIFVNNLTASASEIIAGVLQFYNRAEVIGQKTFGKGTIQSVKDHTHLWHKRYRRIILTTSRYQLPDGTVVDQEGIIPDAIVSESYAISDISNRF